MKLFTLTWIIIPMLLLAACSDAPQITPEQAMSEITLTLDAPNPLPGGDALLWPTRDPIALHASVTNTAPQTFRVTELEEQIEWSAPDGSFSDLFAPDTEWMPPPLSATVPITVTYTCRMQAPGSFFSRPEPLTITASATITVITATPGRLLRDGVLDGFRIGEYPDPNAPEHRAAAALPRQHPETYRVPEVFYKVTEDNFDLHLTEHLRLGDYAMHYPWFSLGLPQYIALDPNLFLKVEDLIALMQQNGYPDAGKIAVVYPFRSPDYNLGAMEQDQEETLKATFSMHQYGKAIDIIIDADGDLVLDDLNDDGVSDVNDALIIAHFVNILDRRYREAGDPRMGGAGVYTHNDFHQRRQTPYIHIDVRNYTGAGGQLIRWPSRLDDGTVLEWGKI